MVVIFYISVFLLAVLGLGLWFAIRVRNSQASLPTNTTLPSLPDAPKGRALFANQENAAIWAAEETERIQIEMRAALLSRALSGDVSVLAEAHSDVSLYREVLDALTEQASEDGALLALIRQVVQQAEGRATPRLAAVLTARWQVSPQTFAVTDVLRIAALSDDAAVFEQTMVAIQQVWQARRLTQFAASQLCQAIESEYWLLSSEARNSGAGFLLKQKLVAVRRELAAVAQRISE